MANFSPSIRLQSPSSSGAAIASRSWMSQTPSFILSGNPIFSDRRTPSLMMALAPSTSLSHAITRLRSRRRWRATSACSSSTGKRQRRTDKVTICRADNVHRGKAQLDITHVLKNTTGPVLFIEGVTDEIILETAWTKFYPDAPRPFDIQGTFGCGSRGAVARGLHLRKSSRSTLFGLSDFDEAYSQMFLRTGKRNRHQLPANRWHCPSSYVIWMEG